MVLFVCWASGGSAYDEAVEPAQTLTLGADDSLSRDTDARVLTVVTFNIAYGRGPAGDGAGPWERSHIIAHLDGIAGQAKSADLVFLQEVDRDASRSHNIDQAAYLQAKLGLGYASCVDTWIKNYVPFPYWPPSKHYGGMHSGQCVLSRYPLEDGKRYALPQPEANAWWRNLFYLERALQSAVVRTPDGPIHVINVHFEAFDQANRESHARMLADVVAEVPADAPLIVAGDFNAPPAEAEQLHGFADEPETDFRTDTTLALTRATGLKDVLGGSGFTFPADGASRRLDYLFARGFTPSDAEILAKQPPWSDHLPIVVQLRDY